MQTGLIKTDCLDAAMTKEAQRLALAEAVGIRCGFAVLDAGHKYELDSLDGDHGQILQFVKRCDREKPWRYPGNVNSYPGATLQMVIRVLLDRLAYLQWQIWCPENWIIIKLLQCSIWLLELRAARRHRRMYWHGLRYVVHAPICRTCGHTTCDHDP